MKDIEFKRFRQCSYSIEQGPQDLMDLGTQVDLQVKDDNEYLDEYDSSEQAMQMLGLGLYF